MWCDPYQDLIRALEKVVDLPAESSQNREFSVEYVERYFTTFQFETDIILFGTPDQVAQLKQNRDE